MYLIRRLLIITATLLLLGAGPAIGAKIVYTDKNVDFYGYSEMLKVGDVVEAYDPAGTLCGTFTVETDGRYGILHVYGDDPTTPEDEGARPGDRITFKVNGKPVDPKGPGTAVWTSDGDSIQVDF